MLHRAPTFIIYFGDSGDAINKEKDCFPHENRAQTHQKFYPFIQNLALKDIALLHQVHGIDGHRVEKSMPAFTKEGDYLITEKKHLGLGILTADCLPIVFYDHAKHIAAIAHAGWRGSVAGIAQKTIDAMVNVFKTNVTDLEIFFGPSAKPCCYNIDKKFYNAFPLFAYKDKVFIKNDNQYFFDVPQLNTLQLISAGINCSQINQTYNKCTICNLEFSSFRREKGILRQINIITLL